MTIHIPDRRIQSMLKRLLQAGLQAADPEVMIRTAVKLKGQMLWIGKRQYRLSRYNRIVCVGAGKASGKMALAIQKILGNRLEGGIVVVKEAQGCRTKKILVREAGHPVPDKRSQQAGKAILELSRSLTRDDLLIVLLSGGASSLLVAPAANLSLAVKQRTATMLLRSGAGIQEINVVRKHLSAIKGGRLAEATSATILGLMLSDVLGDDVSTIGSGPTAPDPSSFKEAKAILQSYGLWTRLPQSVQAHIRKGLRGTVSETPKPERQVFRRVYHHVVGNNRLAVEGMANAAKTIGLHSVIVSTALTGEARVVGNMVGTIAKHVHASGRIARPACLIWGGELTVTVKGKGKGGRAQEFALSAAQEIAGLPNVFVAGFGTDGVDGPTDAAGAVVSGETLRRAQRQGLDSTKFLKRHDSYSFFKKAGGHIVIGQTGTNVNDIYLIIAL